MAGEITIPLLPCHSINAMLDFYEAMGFSVTYRQERPNNYAAVRWQDIELHFFSMRGYEPANSYSTCYVRVLDVDGLYGSLMGALRERYGRIPSAGIPRVIPLKNKAHNMREFIVVDPGGNWIRIGQQMVESNHGETDLPARLAPTPLSRATHAATLLADSKGDYEAAAARLDSALASEQEAPAIHLVQALVFRAALAITMNDLPLARQRLNDLRQVPLQEDERAALREELERAAELEHQLLDRLI